MEMRWVKRRVSRSSSSFESRLGSTVTPPFAPPNGMSMSAVFHVMMAARPSTSSWSASRWQRIQDAPHVALEVDEVGRALELALHDGLARHRGAGGRSTQEHLRE